MLLVSHDRDFLDRVATSVVAAEGDGRWTEYAGGYSDMLAQGGGVAGGSAEVVGTPGRRAAASARAAKPAARKLSFKDKHALERLPGEMATLEAEIRRLREVLGDGGLYGRDPVRFTRSTDALAAAEAALAAAEERWLELELLRDEVGSG